MQFSFAVLCTYQITADIIILFTNTVQVIRFTNCSKFKGSYVPNFWRLTCDHRKLNHIFLPILLHLFYIIAALKMKDVYDSPMIKYPMTIWYVCTRYLIRRTVLETRAEIYNL